MSDYHIPVMLDEVLEALQIQNGNTYIDATAGGGGHTKAIIERGGRVLAIDQDTEAIRYIEQDQKSNIRYASWRTKFKINEDNLKLALGNFKNIKQIATENGFNNVNGVLFDLGVSSFQIDKSGRGFSFLRDEVLDMRMGPDIQISAKDIVNTYSKEELVEIFLRYGEEVKAEKIAQAIVDTRSGKKISTSKELADLVESVVPRTGMVHPATRVFQALRIEVNQELQVLKQAIQDGESLLAEKGRLVVISFHSLEDRIVKQLFRALELAGKGNVITSKPIIPSETENNRNRRARSAKLRIYEKN